MYYAAWERHINIVNLLIENGACVNEKDSDGVTPLHSTARRGHTDIANLLIKNGAFIEAKDSDGITPLHYAAQEGHTDTAKFLIGKRACINAENSRKKTPLYYAIGSGHMKMVKTLIQNGANINAEPADDMTPLIFALTKDYTEIAEFLLSQESIDINKKVGKGITALDIALTKLLGVVSEEKANNNFENIIEILIQKGAKVGIVNFTPRTSLEKAENTPPSVNQPLVVESSTTKNLSHPKLA